MITAGHPSKVVANTILKLCWAKDINDVSQMKLQKLVYFAHGWHLLQWLDREPAAFTPWFPIALENLEV